MRERAGRSRRSGTGRTSCGRGPRRKATKERFWRDHLARQAAGSLTIRGYCLRHDLSEPSFYAWRGELARRDAARRDGHRPSEQGSSRGASFVQVHVSAGVGLSPSAAIEIVLGEGALVRVPPGADQATLATVLATLRTIVAPAARPEPRSC
jgi:hypothetical protein